MTLLTKEQIEALLNGGIVGQCDLRDNAGDLARTALDALARVATLEKVGRIREEEWATFRDAIIAKRDAALTRLAAAEAQVGALTEVLAEGRRAIGDHFAPNDCYATGPLTGDPYRDLVECPACSFIAMHDATVTPPADTKEGRT